jgi:hypothetical protein
MSDPIFAAIEAHRAAWAAFEKDCSRLDDENTPEAEAEFDRLNDAIEEAACTLAVTQPTTTAGAVALLRHAAEHEGKGDTFNCLEDEDDRTMKPWSYFMHRTLGRRARRDDRGRVAIKGAGPLYEELGTSCRRLAKRGSACPFLAGLLSTRQRVARASRC